MIEEVERNGDFPCQTDGAAFIVAAAKSAFDSAVFEVPLVARRSTYVHRTRRDRERLPTPASCYVP